MLRKQFETTIQREADDVVVGHLPVRTHDQGSVALSLRKMIRRVMRFMCCFNPDDVLEYEQSVGVVTTALMEVDLVGTGLEETIARVVKEFEDDRVNALNEAVEHEKFMRELMNRRDEIRIMQSEDRPVHLNRVWVDRPPPLIPEVLHQWELMDEIQHEEREMLVNSMLSDEGFDVTEFYNQLDRLARLHEIQFNNLVTNSGLEMDELSAVREVYDTAASAYQSGILNGVQDEHTGSFVDGSEQSYSLSLSELGAARVDDVDAIDAIIVREQNKVLGARKRVRICPRLVALLVMEVRSKFGLMERNDANRKVLAHHMRKLLKKSGCRMELIDRHVNPALFLAFEPMSYDNVFKHMQDTAIVGYNRQRYKYGRLGWFWRWRMESRLEADP